MAEPKPSKFDILTDEKDADKSHFEYVFCYAIILYMNLGEDCKELKIEKLRPQAKEFVEKMMSQGKAQPVTTDDDEEEKIGDDDEEEIIGEKETSPHEDLDLQANFIDRLGDLRNSLKEIPYSHLLIK